MAALLKAKVAVEDRVEVQLEKGMQKGYMLLSEYNLLHRVAGKVFSSESTAKSYAQGDQIIEVQITRVYK